MKIATTLMFDIFELAEEVFNVLKASPDVAKRSLNQEKITDAIFYWLDNCYLQDRMRWCDPAHPPIQVWCRALDIDPAELDKKSGHHRVVTKLEMHFNELLADILPQRTWKTLFVRRYKGTSFLFEIGEDYRIWYYMNKVHNKTTGVEEG